MHTNSAYFSETVLMRALFYNLDYLLWYQKTFLRTLISARGDATEPGAAYLGGYNELKESIAITETSDTLTLSNALVKTHIWN